MAVRFYRRDSGFPMVKVRIDSTDDLENVAKFISAGDMVQLSAGGHRQMKPGKQFDSVKSGIEKVDVDWTTTWLFDKRYHLSEIALTEDTVITLDETNASTGGAVMAKIDTGGFNRADPDRCKHRERNAESQLDLTFDEATTITTAGWSMSATGGAVTISSVVSGSGTTTPKLGLSRSIANGETVTISYDPATGATTDGSGNELAAITNQAVTNNVAGKQQY
jgi:hypothetical protein